MKNLNLGKLKEYYDLLLNYGGGDLSGDWDEMMKFVMTFDSFEEFIKNEIDVLGEDEELIDEIKNKFL